MNLGSLDEAVTALCVDVPEDLAKKCLVKAQTTDGLCRYRITGVRKILGNEGIELVFVLTS